MRKAKLLELLNSLEGNPDIKLWNGYVEDWVDIDYKLVPTDLVRMTLPYWLESCRLQDCRDLKNWDYQMPAEEVALLTKRYPTVCKWEINPYVTQEDITEKRYSVKTVQIMQAKSKGVKTFDRAGDISY